MTIVVAGATGLAGSAIVRAYEKTGEKVIGINRSVCDLLDRDATIDFIKKAKPAIVVDAANCDLKPSKSSPYLLSLYMFVSVYAVNLAFFIKAMIAVRVDAVRS